MTTQTRETNLERNHYSPQASASISEQMPRGVSAVLTTCAVVALAAAIYALSRADDASEKARMMERESRIMQDDLKYIRAYLSARGIDIPANHEEAESEKSESPHNH